MSTIGTITVGSICRRVSTDSSNSVVYRYDSTKKFAVLELYGKDRVTTSVKLKRADIDQMIEDLTQIRELYK